MSSVLSSVKTTVTYTGEFVGSTADPCFSKGLLESSPSVNFYGNSFFFNYSQSKNVNDLKFLKKFFGGLTTGATFAFSGGQYLNLTSGAVTTWSGVLTLQGKTGYYNEYIYASGVTWSSGLTNGLFTRDLFSTPIQYTAITGNTASYFLHRNPDNDPLNFLYLGVYGSDYGYSEYVEVESSVSNAGRLLTQTCLRLNDQTELIYIDPSVTVANENLYFKKSFVNLYLRGSMDLEIANYDQTINGVLMYTAALPGLYSHLLDNQNRQQYALRTLIDNSLSKLWYPNITLKSFTSISLPSTNNLSYVFSQIYHLYCSTTSVPVYNTSTLESIAEVVGEVYYTTVYIDKVITSTISNPSVYSNGENIKIDLSDARNRDLVVEAFVDENCTVPLTANGYLVGKPGNDGAAFLYLSTVNATFKTFYLKLTRENVSIIHVNLA